MSHTYVTYNEGQEAKHLHLGNLVHDFASPNSLDPYVEKGYSDISELPPPWARSRTLNDFALTLGQASPEDQESEEGDADDAGSGTARRYHVVAAAKTTNIEIKDPKTFFNEVTLTSTEAKKWLASRLSAAETVPQGGPQLNIWMLTGLILMTHATWTSLSSKDDEFIPGEQAPFNPTDTSTIRRLSVSDHVKPAFGFRADDAIKHVSGAVIHETGKYPGLRGWAARWQKVDVKLIPEDKAQENSPNQLKLKVGSKAAVVELLADVYAKNNDSGVDADADDEFWETYLDKAEEFA